MIWYWRELLIRGGLLLGMLVLMVAAGNALPLGAWWQDGGWTGWGLYYGSSLLCSAVLIATDIAVTRAINRHRERLYRRRDPIPPNPDGITFPLREGA